MTHTETLLCLRNLTTLTQYASVKRTLTDERINRLAVILADLQSLFRLDPALVDADLVARLAVAAQRLGVDFSGKR